MDFVPLITAVIALEGGYTDNPADKGGATRYGVTEATARAFGYTGDMATLPMALAISIYAEQYVTAPGFAQIAAIDEELAGKLFDAGVNIGPQAISRMLQRALNCLAYGGKTPHLIVDGKLGRMSRAAITDLYARRGADGKRVLLALLSALQATDYVEICEHDPSQLEFFYGWVSKRAMPP